VTFADDLRATLNRNSRENASNTPDHVLAEYLLGCLDAFDAAARARDEWYGVRLAPGWTSDLNSPLVEATVNAALSGLKDFTPGRAAPPDCPEHREVQHRDGKPAWCRTCGWRHGRPATPAVKLGKPR
jgi:hypothetical protein